jgi:hypothetical protein
VNIRHLDTGDDCEEAVLELVQYQLGYVSDVIVLVHRFITTAIKAIVPDDLMAYSLFCILQDSLQHQYKRAIEQVDFLLHIEPSGTLLTTYHYFNENLEKR